MILFNHNFNAAAYLGADVDEKLGAGAASEPRRWLAACPQYTPTPLHDLPDLARDLGVATIRVKDESARLGLGSFKALGGAYAVVKVVLDQASARLGRTVDLSELKSEAVREIAAGITVGCATGGNHGRSVAAGARIAGCRAVIFVHEGVTQARAQAIADFGATVLRLGATYDDSVAIALERCAQERWHVVSDTSWPGYEIVPLMVMQGYTVMVQEALADLEHPPTHVFLQAGVGGMAAAVAAHLHAVLPEGQMPKVIVVEPARAACLLASMKKGEATKIAHGEPTIMAMLECYEPSLIAWRILSALAFAFMTVDEQDAVNAMKRLGTPSGSDPVIVSGESGCVGLAGLTRLLAEEAFAKALCLDASSRVLLFNTEGATDPQLYSELTGHTVNELCHPMERG